MMLDKYVESWSRRGHIDSLTESAGMVDSKKNARLVSSSTSAMPNDGQNRSLRSLFWPSCAGFHPELSAAARCARDIGHLRVCAAHSSSLNPFVKKMQAFSNLRDFANPAHVI